MSSHRHHATWIRFRRPRSISAPPSAIRSAAMAIACKPDEQKRLMVIAETFHRQARPQRGNPRHVHPCSASGMAQPRITSSISLASSCGTRSSAPDGDRGQVIRTRGAQRPLERPAHRRAYRRKRSRLHA